MRDFYADLGVSAQATPDELRKQYRKLAMQWHPDRHVGKGSTKEAEERFQIIQAAYQVLSDPAQRKDYDRQRTSTYGSRSHQNTPTDEDWYREAMRTAQSARSSDYEEILRDFDLNGEQSVITLSMPFAFADVGVTGQLENVQVRVPPACRDGTVLYAPSGQAYRVHIVYPPGLKREKDDLYLTADLPLPMAILGGVTQFTHWDKRTLSVTWPPNSYTGKKLRLKGCGPLLSNGRRGDLYLEANVVFRDFNPLEIDGIRKLIPSPEILQISPKWGT
jgi:curved DNA-binding protein